MRVLFGEGVAQEIIKAIEEAKKEIIVYSPWISEKYSRLLEEKRKRGVRVEVYARESEKRKFVRRKKRYLALAVLSLLSIPLSLYYPPALFFSLLFPIFSLLYIRGSPTLPFTAINNLHAKVYVIDGKTLLSSANLTESSLRNVEFVVETEWRPEL